MGKEILTYDDLLQIVELIKSAESFSEFHLKIGDIELDLRKSDAGAAAPPATTASTALPAVDAATSAKLALGPADQIAAAGARAAVEVPPGAVVIKSPMVGTFYASPEPGADPYLKVGARVSPGQTVCIIEAMKIMNEIEAEFGGVIREISVEDAQPVEFGQVLFRVDPNG